MKEMLRKAAIIAFGVMFTATAFAADGIKTIIKGSVQGTEVKTLLMLKRDSRSFRISDTVETNGQFQLTTNLTEPGFYMVSSNSSSLNELEMYLNPGDQIAIMVENDLLVMSGKGSGVNQLLYDISKKFPYNQADLLTLTQTYNDRVNAISNSTNEEVIRNKALLLGNTQGEYLDKIYGPVIDSKVHGSTDEIMEVNFTDLNIRLVAEIVIHPNWRQSITELMYAKMKAGQLKVRNMNTWVADFGNAIENQKLKEDFMVALLEYSVSQYDLISIQKVIKESLPLIKTPKNIAKVNALQPKIARGMNFYKNIPIGTDMSTYSFQDVNGKKVSISDFKGKFIFIDIWNTGCKPCIAEFPFLKKMEHDMQEKDIVFLSISCDNNTIGWKKLLQKRNMMGEYQLIMTEDSFFQKIGKSGIPRFVILDKENKMVDYNSCKRPSNPLLNIYLTELLNKS